MKTITIEQIEIDYEEILETISFGPETGEGGRELLT